MLRVAQDLAGQAVEAPAPPTIQKLVDTCGRPLQVDRERDRGVLRHLRQRALVTVHIHGVGKGGVDREEQWLCDLSWLDHRVTRQGLGGTENGHRGFRG
jgi:hypothetical protein